MKALLFIAIICLANSSSAEPIIINLLPSGNHVKKEIKLSLEAAELSLTVKNQLEDLGSITAEMKQDKEEHVIELPIYHAVDERTLRAIAGSLVSLKTLQMKKKDTFKALKTLVMTYFPDATSSDTLKFLKAADMLHVDEFLRPAAAAWIDQYQKENSGILRNWLWGLPKDLRENMPKDLRDVPNELIPLFTNYWTWLHPKRERIVLPIKADSLAIANDKLYAINESAITIFDIKLNRVVKTIPINEWKPYRSVRVFGNKVYVPNNLSIEVIDVDTDMLNSLPLHVSKLLVSGNNLYVTDGRKIDVFDTSGQAKESVNFALRSRHAWRINDFAVANNKLYVATSEGLYVVDLATNQVVKRVAVDDPSHLIVVGQKLYISNHREGHGKIFVIDVITDRVVKSINLNGVYNLSPEISAMGNILFFARWEDRTLSMIDTRTNQIIGEPLTLLYSATDLASSGNRIFVAKAHMSEVEYYKFDLSYLERFDELNAYYSK